MAATDEAGFASARDWHGDGVVVRTWCALVCGYVGVRLLCDGICMSVMVYV